MYVYTSLLLSQCFKGIAKNNGGFLVIASLGLSLYCLPWVLMCWLCMMQGEKECLNSETTELKQKIRYLQDQLLPLSKQREYQEKEIQRLNRVRVGLTTDETVEGESPRRVSTVLTLDFVPPTAGSRGSLKLAFAFVLATTTWPGQLRRRRQ